MAAKLRSFFIRDLLADAVAAPQIQGNHFQLFVQISTARQHFQYVSFEYLNIHIVIS